MVIVPSSAEPLPGVIVHQLSVDEAVHRLLVVNVTACSELFAPKSMPFAKYFVDSCEGVNRVAMPLSSPPSSSSLLHEMSNGAAMSIRKM